MNDIMIQNGYDIVVHFFSPCSANPPTLSPHRVDLSDRLSISWEPSSNPNDAISYNFQRSHPKFQYECHLLRFDLHSLVIQLHMKSELYHLMRNTTFYEMNRSFHSCMHDIVIDYLKLIISCKEEHLP